MTQPNPLHIASMSQNLSKTASPGDANAYNKLALACMVTAKGERSETHHGVAKCSGNHFGGKEAVTVSLLGGCALDCDADDLVSS